MAVENQEQVRRRIRAELIKKEPGIENETDLARVLNRSQGVNRSATREALQGGRSIPGSLLEAIEREFGFSRRRFIESGKWPDDETQAEQIAKLSKEEFNALIDLASNPKLRALAAKLKTTSPENLAILERLLNENVSFANMFMLALERATTAKDNEAELARLKKISSDIKKGLKKK